MLQRAASVSAALDGRGQTAARRAPLAAMDPTASWTVPATTTCPVTDSQAAASVVPVITVASVNWVCIAAKNFCCQNFLTHM